MKQTKDQGVWGKSEESVKLNCKICESVAHGWKLGKTQAGIKYEFPDLPSRGKIRFLAQHYWNEGVKNGVHLVRKLPSYARLGLRKANEKLKEKMEKRSQALEAIRNN